MFEIQCDIGQTWNKLLCRTERARVTVSWMGRIFVRKRINNTGSILSCNSASILGHAPTHFQATVQCPAICPRKRAFHTYKRTDWPERVEEPTKEQHLNPFMWTVEKSITHDLYLRIQPSLIFICL